MTYPQQPGQSYAGQQPYPAQPYPGQPAPSGGFPAQPYPGQAQYPAPGYGTQPPKPSGVTAIIAGVLAVLGGLLYVVGLVSAVVTLVEIQFVPWVFIVVIVENVVVAGLLLPGGILLFLRRPAGRVLTIIGCGLDILLAVVSLVLDALGVMEYAAGIGGWYIGGAFVALLMTVIPSGTALVLASVKPTARWCARPVPAFPGYPPR